MEIITGYIRHIRHHNSFVIREIPSYRTIGHPRNPKRNRSERVAISLPLRILVFAVVKGHGDDWVVGVPGDVTQGSFTIHRAH